MTRIIDDFPRAVSTIAHEWIPLGDGRRLAARIWLPEAADRDPVPALLEYHPYGKGGARAVWDPSRHAYLAGHGYASVRVDLAGSGESDGYLLDEYLPREQEDAVAVIAWLAEQPWCTGSIGMFGISWGGFNSLQVAALRPPGLKAIVSACASDDRYADDVHYMGGCVVGLEMLSWATTMLALNGASPDPDVLEDGWREQWLDRIATTSPFVDMWLSHQLRDDYWKQGSVCENYAAIACPTFLVGGWFDGYRNAVLRLLANLKAPVRAIIGPWGHGWPDTSLPGPDIGFLHEMLRWWDHWLKGVDTGVMDDPALRVWMPDAVRPQPYYSARPGRWLAESSWPSPKVRPLQLFLHAEALRDSPAVTSVVQHQGRLVPASDQGPWCAAGRNADFPGDQQAEDGQSLSFTSTPFTAATEILGQPIVQLTLAVDRPVAHVVARLCDVWPDGASTLITRGILNVAHGEGHELPSQLRPDEEVSVDIELQATAYRLPVGHRLRIAVSSSYWPFVWPSPQLVTLSVLIGPSRLLLPVRAGEDETLLSPFMEPELAPMDEFELLDTAVPEPEARRFMASGRADITWPRGSPGIRMPHGLVYQSHGEDAFTIVEGDPLSARAVSTRCIESIQGDVDLRVEAKGTMVSTANEFIVTSTLDAYERGQRVAARSWESHIPRNHV